MGNVHSQWEAYEEREDNADTDTDVSSDSRFHQTTWMKANDVLPTLKASYPKFSSWEEYASYTSQQRTKWLADGTLHRAQFNVLTTLSAKNPYRRTVLMDRLLSRSRYVRTPEQFEHLEKMVLVWVTQHMHLNVHFQLDDSERFSPTGQWLNSLDWFYNHNVRCYRSQERVLRRRPIIENRAFQYDEDTPSNLRPTYGAVNIAGIQHGNCCAYTAYGDSFFGLSNDLLPRMTIAEADTGNAEKDPAFKVYTAENAMMLLWHFHDREWHLLFKYLLVAGIFERLETPQKWQDAWVQQLREGLERDERPCPCDENDDNRRRTYRELGIHGGWNWKKGSDVKYIVFPPISEPTHQAIFSEHFDNKVEGAIFIRESVPSRFKQSAVDATSGDSHFAN